MGCKLKDKKAEELRKSIDEVTKEIIELDKPVATKASFPSW